MRRVLMAMTVALTGMAAIFAAEGERSPLEGRWKVKSIIVNGKEAMVAGSPAECHFAGRTLTYRGSDTTDHITLDNTQNPAHMDSVSKRPGFPDLPTTDIYRIEGDRLTLNVDVDGNGRPRTFESPEGAGYRLIVLERIKK
jgi:uncharacterized protein (TIGR03067 family)